MTRFLPWISLLKIGQFLYCVAYLISLIQSIGILWHIDAIHNLDETIFLRKILPFAWSHLIMMIRDILIIKSGSRNAMVWILGNQLDFEWKDEVQLHNHNGHEIDDLKYYLDYNWINIWYWNMHWIWSMDFKIYGSIIREWLSTSSWSKWFE